IVVNNGQRIWNSPWMYHACIFCRQLGPFASGLVIREVGSDFTGPVIWLCSEIYAIAGITSRSENSLQAPGVHVSDSEISAANLGSHSPGFGIEANASRSPAGIFRSERSIRERKSSR